MAKNNSSLIRYITIDQCLQSRGRKWNWKDLQKACGEKLLDAGIDKIPQKRTIEHDLKVLRDGFLFGEPAPIGRTFTPNSKLGYYTYTDPNFSILNMQMPKEVVATLKQSINIVKQLSVYSVFSDIGVLVQKLEKRVAEEGTERYIIDFEKNPGSEGIKRLDVIYNAIINKQALDISYHPFHRAEPNHVIVHPYLLKEYRNRWFLVGLSFFKAYTPNIKVFGLERMTRIKNSRDSFIPPTGFNPKEYFKYALGTSARHDREPQEIILSFNYERGQYIKTKPLHHSQKTLVDNKEEVRVSLQLAITREVVRMIISYREHVKVLAPKKLIDDIKIVLQRMVNMYSD